MNVKEGELYVVGPEEYGDNVYCWKLTTFNGGAAGGALTRIKPGSVIMVVGHDKEAHGVSYTDVVPVGLVAGDLVRLTDAIVYRMHSMTSAAPPRAP